MEEKTKDHCEIECVRSDVVARASKNVIPDRDIADVSEIFKLLGDPTRCKILQLLHNEELCVCEIAECMDVTVSAVSHQLRLLRSAKLVKNRRDGRVLYYTLDDEHVSTLINIAIEHVQHR